MRTCILIFSVLLAAFASFFGQSLPSDTDADSATKASAGESEAEHGVDESGFEILNQGKDPDALREYPFQILASVRSKWYSQLGELQSSIGRKRGIAIIDFEINHDGSLGKLTTAQSTGDAPLDAVATIAILRSAPVMRLPEAYHEKALKMRMHFGYDQPVTAKAPFCNGPNWGAHPVAYEVHHVGNSVTPPKPTYSPDPEYSEVGRKDKYMSIVMIAGTVDLKGAFTDLCVAQAAGEGLDEKAMGAVSTWRFEPATLQREPVAVRLKVEVSFRLY